MQNAQNTEIQQRVIELVNLYRAKVGGEDSLNSKTVKEFEEAEEKRQWELQAKEHAYPISTSVTIPEEMLNKLKVNEQLLGHFYLKVFGENAKDSVAKQLFVDFYDNSVFAENEENFLTTHFREMTNYIISTPCNQMHSRNWDEKDIYLIPQEVLELVCEHVNIPANSLVFNPFAGFGQFATTFNNCTFICDESYSVFNEQNNLIEDYPISAWMKVALAANRVVENYEDNSEHSFYDAIVSYIPFIPRPWGDKMNDINCKFETFVTDVMMNSYSFLKNDGKMAIIIPTDLCWKSNKQYAFKSFWEQVINDGNLSEIIQLPRVMSFNCEHDYCVVIVSKVSDTMITMTDARFASRVISSTQIMSIDDFRKNLSKYVGVSLKSIMIGDESMVMASSGESNFIYQFDNHKLIDASQNGGNDIETGLRKIVKVEKANLNIDLMIPQVYVVETPSDVESPVSLSSICSMSRTRVRDINYDLPKDTIWIKEKDLSYIYQGELNLVSGDIEKADCPNIPPHTDDYIFNERGELESDSPWAQQTAIGKRVLDYRDSFFLDGSCDTILYKNDKLGTKLALVRATGKPFVVENGIFIFIPNENTDVLQLYVLLSQPLVSRQIQAFRDFGTYANLHNVLVPTNKRIIKDVERTALNEERAFKSHEERLLSMKTEYINEVRMRKHDMGQYIFELMNIEDLMRYYIENRDTEKDFCKNLEELLDNFHSSLGELSSLLDNLSKEEQFGEPELFGLNEFLSHLTERHKADGFKINYFRDDLSIMRYNQKQYRDDSIDDLLIDAQIQAHEEDMALDDAMLDAQIQAHEDNQYVTDDISDMVDLDMIESPMDISKRSYIIPSLYVAPNDMQRLVSNIVDNARKHGFTDHSRKDYEIKVSLSIDVEKNMFQIDFRNNGNPLPEGMNKMRYGIKGEKAGKTAGTGMGGSYVKSFVEHYGGDYDIFMADGWTVVRIYLPIK